MIRLAVMFLSAFVSSVVAGRSGAATIDEFAIPTAASLPQDLVVGPDGNVWFTQRAADKIGRITSEGAVTEFSLPSSGSEPVGIAVGPDGAVWFTEYAGNRIGRITTSGSISEFPLLTTGAGPYSIAAGNDGNLWFTGRDGTLIGSITTAGVVTEVPLPGGDTPIAIAATPSGWDADGAGATGAVVFTTTTPDSLMSYAETPATFSRFRWVTGSDARGIAASPDGSVWVALAVTDQLCRMSRGIEGESFCVSLPNAGSTPTRLAADSDGAVWFTEFDGNRIGRVTADGEIVEIDSPTASSGPFGVAVSADGTVWFTEENGNAIGRLRLGSEPDAVLAIAKTVKGKIAAGAASAPKKGKLSVVNAGPSEATVELTLGNGTCPAGIVGSAPDFDKRTAGVQSTITLPAHSKAKATFTLTLSASDIRSTPPKGRYRCRIEAIARLVGPGVVIDPSPSNNHALIAVEVLDGNDL